MQTPKIRKTNDLHLAAFLSVVGVTFKGFKGEGRRPNGKPEKVAFLFSDELGNFDELKTAYVTRQAVKMKMLNYVEELKNFKSQTHEIMSTIQDGE